MKKRIYIAVLTLLLFSGFIGHVFAGGEKDGTGQRGKKQTLTFLTFLNPHDDVPRSIAQNQIIDGFKAKNPNIEINVQVVGWAEIAPLIIRGVTAGNPPDVTRINSDSLEQQYGAGTLMDLWPFINALPDANAYKNDFVLPFDMALDNGAKRYIWSDQRPVMLYYNKNHLKEIGLTEPPRTWDEIGAASQKLSE
ncbi:MAG: ABC transporter substrate-binding protein, partial [Treponema sp.]|nr:ABC transporter substrate-binding protein [Treponema sp.]